MAGRHRVLIIGGGFGGLRAARALKSAPVDVTLIDREWAIEDLTFSRGARLITGPALTDFDCNKEMAGGEPLTRSRPMGATFRVTDDDREGPRVQPRRSTCQPTITL